ISDISSSANEKSPDGYSVRLYDTSLPDQYAIFKKMPEDTLLCFRKNVLMQSLANKNDKSSYEYQKSIFKSFIEQQKDK
ncbi:MAG: hypothetical protein IJE84_05230, partial [Clostridia bacterium]|nr:hypothetical protein [Clostridia bacterium]